MGLEWSAEAPARPSTAALVIIAIVALVLLGATANPQDRGIPNDPATTTTEVTP